MIYTMQQTRSLRDRASDRDNWSKKLADEERAEFWDSLPYDERRGLSACEVADMRVQREMRKLEIAVLGEGDK